MEEDGSPETKVVFSGQPANLEDAPHAAPHGASHPPQLDNTMGIVGLVLGVLGLGTLLMAGPFNLCLAIPGMVFSVMAKKAMDETPGSADRGLVMAGYVINIINIIIGLLFILFVGALIGLLASSGGTW